VKGSCGNAKEEKAGNQEEAGVAGDAEDKASDGRGGEEAGSEGGGTEKAGERGAGPSPEVGD